MEAYTGFAQVYDLFMDDVPYEAWSRYLTGLLQEYGVEEGLVLELGCGTGTMTRLLAAAGYDMIGVDCSEEMLQIAKEAAETGEGTGKQKDILYLLQDMREFELYGTVKAVVSVCDSLNYILEEDELQKVFSLVNNYLDPGGMFLFDLNTVYKYEELLGETTICENRDEGSFIWENYYDRETQINEYDLTFFIREESGLYRRFEETHYQRAYSPEAIKRLLTAAGMKFVGAYDAFTREPAGEKSGRICFIGKPDDTAYHLKYFTLFL